MLPLNHGFFNHGIRAEHAVGRRSRIGSGVRAEIRGFGRFSLDHFRPRTWRNPKTGIDVQLSAKWSPHFKAGKEMREQIDVLPAPEVIKEDAWSNLGQKNPAPIWHGT